VRVYELKYSDHTAPRAIPVCPPHHNWAVIKRQRQPERSDSCHTIGAWRRLAGASGVNREFETKRHSNSGID
jgi:hypothetical protein